jgi:hypothetical protein
MKPMGTLPTSPRKRLALGQFQRRKGWRAEHRHCRHAQRQRDRLDAGDAVDPVHEIVEVDEPHPEQHRGGAIQQRGKQALEYRQGSVED